MRCPFCANTDTQVKDSRPAEEGASIRRRRYCAACDSRFTTFERVQLRELVVLKQNGEKKPFDRDKLVRSLHLALRKRPVTKEQLEIAVNNVVRDLENAGSEEITSKQVGLAVMQALKQLDTVAYIRFASVYQNFDQLKDFEAFMDKL